MTGNESAELARLRQEHAAVALRLEEAEETLRAIQNGTVDAIVVDEQGDRRVYSLDGADRPYRLMVEQMQQGAATLRADGTIVYCNMQVANLLGLPHAGLIGASLRAFVEVGDLQIYDELLQRSSHQCTRAEVSLNRADGVTVPTFLTFNPLPADCRADVGVLITDLTAQRHHEQLSIAHKKLRESEARFRQIARGVDAVFYVADTHEQRIHYVSPAFERLWKLDSSELYRDAGFWQNLIHPDDRAHVTEAYAAFLAGAPTYDVEYRICLPQGEQRWVRDRATVSDAVDDGRLLTGIIDDITVRRLAEERLREADHRKDEFLATLAHELRGPLAPLSNMLAILQHTDGRDPAAIHQAREIMERQVAQLVRLVDDLLDVNRISRGKMELKRLPVEVSTIVERAIEATAPLATQRSHRVNVVGPADPVFLYADPVRLTQVLSNLLNNACKYMQPGGTITVSVQPGDGDVLIKVRDTGEGVPPEKLRGIFDMFAQVDQSLERSHGGLGIGLTLVRRLVEMHGGTVEAFSEGVGHGSEFVVCLPRLSRAPNWGALSADPDASAAERRILIVDDNVDSAQSLALLLSMRGNKTHVAHDGLEAVAAAERYRPDVVLLDIGLPKLNGYDVCRRIREQPWGANMRLVAVTGLGQDADRKRSQEARFDGHIVKPVDLGLLMKLLSVH